jgi:DNA replication protein DnaC
MNNLRKTLNKISADTTATSPTPPTPTTPTDAPRVTHGIGDPDCPRCHGLGYLREDLPVGHPNFGKAQPCTCQMENMQLRRAAQLREESNTETLAGKSFENFLPEGLAPDPDIRATVSAAFKHCRAFAENPDRPDENDPDKKWLLLMGTYGSGKTHLAAAIANHCLAQHKPVLFLNTPDLLDFLRETFAPGSDTTYSDRFEEIRAAPLLILDDLGTESPTPWAVEKLYQILNYRYNAHLPTVITTNKKIEEMEPRIASRLSDVELVYTLNILAPDYRSGKMGLTADVSTLALHRNQTFDTFDHRSDLTGEARQWFLNAIRAAQDYAEEPQGWFVLTGPYASGKTHLAAAMANQRAQMGKPATFVTYQDLMELFRSGGREQDERNARAIQHLRNVDFLVIDDISVQLSSAGYYRERFFQIFNHRYDAGLPTVLTTSADDKELDPRIKSRIFQSDVCQVHTLRVEAYRGKKKARRR